MAKEVYISITNFSFLLKGKRNTFLIFSVTLFSLYIPQFLYICKRDDSSSQGDVKCHSGLSAARLMKRLTKRKVDIYCLEIKNLNHMEVLLCLLFFFPSYLFITQALMFLAHSRIRVKDAFLHTFSKCVLWYFENISGSPWCSHMFVNKDQVVLNFGYPETGSKKFLRNVVLSLPFATSLCATYYTYFSCWDTIANVISLELWHSRSYCSLFVLKAFRLSSMWIKGCVWPRRLNFKLSRQLTV